MAVKGRGLGKGLDSLIPSATSSMSSNNSVEQVDSVMKITLIEPNRNQPRKNFDEDSLLELSDSIKQFGILQPIIIHKKDDYYEIIAGERRWRAAKLANLKEVPVIIKKYTEQEIVEIALIENIQRENLNPIEEAFAYKKLITEYNLKQDEVAERVSKSRTAVTNSMRLLKLSDKVQDMIISDMISTGHARAILSVEDPEEQYMIAQKIFDEKLSVRDVEKLIKDRNKIDKPVKNKNEEVIQYIYQNFAEKLKDKLSTKVQIIGKDNGTGKIEIEFFSNDELERIYEVLK
ncbi:MAG: ParB/RepB/Spo0J family partition protein [Eubacteriales bacterium]